MKRRHVRGAPLESSPHEPSRTVERVGELLDKIIRFLRQRRPALRWKGVDDPRSRRGRRYTLPAMLNAVVLAMMCGATSIRLAVGKARRFGSAMRKLVAVCACGRTAIGDLLARLDPAQLREQLVGLIRGEWYRKALRPERLPLGLVAIDGKAIYSARQCFHPEAQDQRGEDADKKYEGHRCWVLRVLRACLVSSASCPVIDQGVIPAATNETGFFATFFRGLMQAYGRLNLFQAISVDAGMVSRANADLVHEAGLHYVFRLKSTQPELWREATRLFGLLSRSNPPEHETPWESDSARGRIRRQLWRTTDMAGWNDWDHLARAWYVRTVADNGDGTVEVIEQRYWVTSLPHRRLSARQILDVVRCHWGIENDANGTADIFFDEDHSPCSKTGEGIVCASLLRLIAINLCQLFRHRRHRGIARKRKPWALLFDDIFFALRLPRQLSGQLPAT